MTLETGDTHLAPQSDSVWLLPPGPDFLPPRSQGRTLLAAWGHSPSWPLPLSGSSFTIFLLLPSSSSLRPGPDPGLHPTSCPSSGHLSSFRAPLRSSHHAVSLKSCPQVNSLLTSHGPSTVFHAGLRPPASNPIPMLGVEPTARQQ